MLIAPHSLNSAASGTVSTGAALFQLGWPSSNIFTADPRQAAIWRGPYTVTASTNDAIDFVDTDTRAATLTPGTYNSPMELAVEIAAQMNVAGGRTNYAARLIQGASNTHRWNIVDTNADTFTLPNATGANAATNALVLLLGYAAYDRSAAASHVGDFAAIHGGACSCLVDMATPKLGEFGAIIRPLGSPALSVQVAMGSTSACSDGTEIFAGGFDDEIMCCLYSSPLVSRYVRLDLYDPKREDDLRLGAGYWYHGPVFRSDDSGGWQPRGHDPRSSGRSWQQRHAINRTIKGQPHIAEVEPLETISVSFSSLGQQRDELEALADALGVSEYAIICLDTTELNSSATFARLTQPPSFVKRAIESGRGRWSLAMNWERVPEL